SWESETPQHCFGALAYSRISEYPAPLRRGRLQDGTGFLPFPVGRSPNTRAWSQPVTVTPGEKAEVLLAGSVAVAVTHCPKSNPRPRLIVKLATPLLPVITVNEPKNRRPCAGLSVSAKNSRV